MKKGILLLLVLLIAILGYWFGFRNANTDNDGPNQQALKVGVHSSDFNKSIDAVMTAYFDMQNAFVDADTTKAKDACKKMIERTKEIKLDELKKDTSVILVAVSTEINSINTNAESLLSQKNITEMRQDFRVVGENIYPLLKTIHYEGKPLYMQNCPMAFGEGKEATWISNTREIANPYLGKNHPEFKATMLHCGEIVDSIVAK